ncbi:Uncharacterized protein BM_BM13939 [Brugia malayi]|uniref:BMA-RIOK-1, isoform e n=1 Tax=Brugia malayi TaxID=6279 RepID=A0A1P6BLY3_BRUMA|nr:Uncharacterized protein BM_BM13939 [Brugia malayi]CDQ02572.1 BMA-RIOK-1, isoform e [Brugia malayi]VIO96585.1 Uncharacterized protein BM_BM13939 [Brugia malayi]
MTALMINIEILKALLRRMAKISTVGKDRCEFVSKEQIADSEKSNGSDIEDDDGWERMYSDDYDDLIAKFGSNSKV